MRPLILAAAVVAFCAGSTASGGEVLRLSDPKLPLQELRPLDRHVTVLTLEGEWKKPATTGILHYVNILFPNGRSYSHRVFDDDLFRLGEVRVVLPEYVLLRNGVARKGTFTVVVSARRSVTSASAPEVISNRLTVHWPLDRPVVRRPPRTRYTPAPPIDALPPVPDESVPPGRKVPPPPARLPPPRPPAG